jgi:hypothetical protein
MTFPSWIGNILFPYRAAPSGLATSGTLFPRTTLGDFRRTSPGFTSARPGPAVRVSDKRKRTELVPSQRVLNQARDQAILAIVAEWASARGRSEEASSPMNAISHENRTNDSTT